MNRERKANTLLMGVLVLGSFVIAGCSSSQTDSRKSHDAVGGAQKLRQIDKKNRIRLEHVAINVEDPVAMAKWYCENLDMKVVRKGPSPVNMHFIRDAGANMMLEVYNNPADAVPNYATMDPLLLHISFMVDDVKEFQEKLIAAGATLVEGVTVTASGDEIAMLRDPWGVPIQFVKRAKPMLSHR